jgi:uncharacterized membrane protein
VDHDRFDDVEFTFVEEPEPAPPPRRRRRGLVAAAVIVAGGLAAGATAIASQDEPPAAKAPAKAFDVRESHRGDGCRKGAGRHHRDKSAEQDTGLRY